MSGSEIKDFAFIAIIATSTSENLSALEPASLKDWATLLHNEIIKMVLVNKMDCGQYKIPLFIFICPQNHPLYFIILSQFL
jgi:hypothetical protein